MTNSEFIEKYGKVEFYDIAKHIYQDLQIARLNKVIGKFKIYNNKKKVKFYRKDKTFIILDFATIYSVGCDNLKKYIEERK